MNGINRLNEWIARRTTIVFGTMWMFYAFFVYGLLPLIPAVKQYESQIFYWSGWVQLWALPLLMVGQVVLGRNAEERAQQDHITILAEFAEIKALHEERKQEILALQATHEELVDMHQQIVTIVKQEGRRSRAGQRGSTMRLRRIGRNR